MKKRLANNHWQIALMLIVLGMVGCSGQPTISDSSIETPMVNRFTIVSIADPKLTIHTPAVYAWHPNSIEVHAEEHPSLAQAETILKQKLVSEMDKKGYTQATAEQECNYWISYVIAAEDSLDDEMINKRFGLKPGFVNKESRIYTKGTIVIDLVDAKAGAVVWRSAVQGVMAPELPAEERQKRLSNAVKQMLDDMPDARK